MQNLPQLLVSFLVEQQEIKILPFDFPANGNFAANLLSGCQKAFETVCLTQPAVLHYVLEEKLKVLESSLQLCVVLSKKTLKADMLRNGRDDHERLLDLQLAQ